MDRKEYNECMKPYLTGTKTKEQRKLDFCIGAKVCSGKAADMTEAKELCEDNKTPDTQKPIPAEVSTPVENPAPTAPSCSGQSMAEWVNEEDNKVCRPCLLGPVTQWYRDTLNENGHEDLASSLIEVAANGEPLTLCEELDRIKGVVGDTTRERLKDFDCAVQTFSPDDSAGI